MKQYLVKDLLDLKKLIESEILSLVKPQTLFLISGELGAGKTEFIKIIAEKNNMKEIQSPTFALHHAYQNGQQTFHHVDLYRLKSEEDLESTGFWDLFENENDVIFVEWSNLLLPSVWPWNWSQIFIEIIRNQNGTREILIKQPQG